MPLVRRNIVRPDKRLIEKFYEIPVATISDAMDRFNTMDSGIKPLFGEVKICGPAVTVREMVGCNIMIHKAIEVAKEGDVIVVDGRGHKDTALGGWIICLNAKVRGVAGIVVDGAWRDTCDIRRAKYPVFARAVVPNGPHKGYPGDVNVQIQCGGVSVNPGDIIVGDDDGVVVVPQEKAKAVLERACEIMKKEEDVKKKVLEGGLTVDIYGFQEKLRQLGVKEEE